MESIIGKALISICTLGLVMSTHAQLALTPPMGWNSWNTFAGDIDETKIKQTADLMVSNGMKAAGYIYVNIDDNWMSPTRDGQGNIQADPTRFPSGIKGIADYVHAKGLKLGVYSDRGDKTCMNIPNSGGYGHEAQDAKTYASWGVDYLKYDNCNAKGEIKADYTAMSNGIKATGAKIVFSICAWHTEDWMPLTGQLWRSTEDITSTWYNASKPKGWSVLQNFDQNVGNFIFTHPGAWADPDMLEVGNSPLNDTENKAHIGLWALVAAPLIAGNNLTKMSATTLATMIHSEVIAIDQDSAGIQGRRIQKTGDLEVWAKPLGKNYDTYAIGLFNRSSSTANMTIKWSDLRLDPATVTVRDVWEKKDLGVTKDGYSSQVPSHGLTLIKVTGKQDLTASWWLSDLHFTSLENAVRFVKVDSSSGGKAMRIGTKTYTKGLGAHAASRIVAPLNRNFDKFQADVGIDAEITSGGSAIFQVFGDGKKLFESPACKSGSAALPVDVSVKGVDTLTLVVTDNGDGTSNDNADWADAKLIPSFTPVAIRSMVEPAQPIIKVQGKMINIERVNADPAEVKLIDPNGKVVMTASISGFHAGIQVPNLGRGLYSVVIPGASNRAFRFLVMD
ncbi:MAG: NPCBM/NEW2 domain-containing protein [Fibrobacteria bacterium]